MSGSNIRLVAATPAAAIPAGRPERSAHHLKLVHSAPYPSASAADAARPDWQLTSRDLISLTEWMLRADAHGYRRVLIETGVGGAMPEDGGYVLLYAAGEAWAQWGLTRVDGGVAIWHCGTGADLGRFPSMLPALESLPPASLPQPKRARRQRTGQGPSLFSVQPRT